MATQISLVQGEISDGEDTFDNKDVELLLAGLLRTLLEEQTESS